MDDIVERIRRVSEAMGTVATSADAQASGLARVDEAVAGLDEVTQQNSALVEESAAATESMRQQAQRLHELVGSFRLSA